MVLDLRKPKVLIEAEMIVMESETKYKFRKTRKRWGNLGLPLTPAIAELIKYLDRGTIYDQLSHRFVP